MLRLAGLAERVAGGFIITPNIDKLVKSQGEDPRWLDKKFDIRPKGSALIVVPKEK